MAHSICSTHRSNWVSKYLNELNQGVQGNRTEFSISCGKMFTQLTCKHELTSRQQQETRTFVLRYRLDPIITEKWFFLMFYKHAGA